jgi:hypothetical protein
LPKTAERLVGRDLICILAKSEPSHFGGKILSYRVETEGRFAGRFVFKFRFSPAYKDVKTDRIGWGNEKKVEFD